MTVKSNPIDQPKPAAMGAVSSPAQAPEQVPAGEAADQPPILSVKGYERGIEPAFHLLDRRMVGGQDTGPGEEVAQVVVRSISGQHPEGVVADRQLSSGHHAKELDAGRGWFL